MSSRYIRVVDTSENSIPLYVYSTSRLSIPLSMDAWVAIANNATMNIAMQLSLQDPAFNTLDMYSEVRSMDHGSSIFNF